MWVDKVKNIANKKGVSLKEIASIIDMSESNLYKCFNRGSIETRHMEKLANALGVPVSFFFEEDSNSGHRVKAAGDKSVAVAGNGNFFSGESISKGDTTRGGEDNILSEKVKMLEKLLEEKERVIEEKERLIKILMEKR